MHSRNSKLHLTLYLGAAAFAKATSSVHHFARREEPFWNIAFAQSVGPLRSEPDLGPMRKTKIIATLGPATDSPEMVARLLEAGMNVARLNMSHATPDWVRRVVRGYPGCCPRAATANRHHDGYARPGHSHRRSPGGPGPATGPEIYPDRARRTKRGSALGRCQLREFRQ